MLENKKKELIIGAVVALVFVSLGVLKAFLQPSESSVAIAGPHRETGISASDYESTTLKVRNKLEVERKEKALAAIAEHEAAMARNWGAKDTPDRLMAVGNLYQYQLADHHSAIQNYRTLVDSYPKHSPVAQAYIEMAACYEKMGEETQAMYVYREMVDTLEPSLQHVKYAKLKLEGK